MAIRQGNLGVARNRPDRFTVVDCSRPAGAQGGVLTIKADEFATLLKECQANEIPELEVGQRTTVWAARINDDLFS